MKTNAQQILKNIFISVLLLSVSLGCCFGQTDTNLIATGDWSEAVSDSDGHTLRGRMLIYDEHSQSAANHARVYLELQHTFQGGWTSPLEIYFNSDLHFELRDNQNQPVPLAQVKIRGPVPNPCWVTLPCDSTLRLRADTYTLGPLSKPDGLEILVENGCWIIPPNPTNDFFLSATFTPPKDNPSPLKYHVWQGTLKLPPVKIPAKSPMQTSSKPADVSLTYREPDSGITFNVESDRHHVAAVAEDGKVLWRRQPATDGNLPPYSESRPLPNPLIIWIGALRESENERLKKTGSGKFIGVSFNSRQFGVLDVKNGDFIFQGQD